MLETTDPFHILNRKNSFGHTPMYIAAKNGNLDVVRLLVEKKANCDLASRVSFTLYCSLKSYRSIKVQ